MNEHCEGICPSDLTVMLTKPLDLRRLQSELHDVPQRVGIKPRGFWFACGDEWINLVRGQWDMAEKFDGDFIYKIEIDRSRVAHILTRGDILRFHRQFASFTDSGMMIDWRRVAFDYDGVIICPFQASVRYSLDWYLPWDVASGCVWRREAITGVSNISNKANPR